MVGSIPDKELFATLRSGSCQSSALSLVKKNKPETANDEELQNVLNDMNSTEFHTDVTELARVIVSLFN